MAIVGCATAPGLKNVQTNSSIKAPTNAVPCTEPLIIEVQVNNRLDLFDHITKSELYPKLKEAGPQNEWADKADDRVRENFELYRINGLFYASELIHSLRQQFPNSHVFLGAMDTESQLQRLRDFSWVSGRKHKRFWPGFGIYPNYFGSVEIYPGPTAPSSVVIDFTLDKGNNPSAGLDSGMTYGDVLSESVMAFSGTNQLFFYSSIDPDIPISGAKQLTHLQAIQLASQPSKPIWAKAEKDKAKWGYGKFSLSEVYFTNPPNEEEWKKNELEKYAQYLEMNQQWKRLKPVDTYKADKNRFDLGSSEVANSPFAYAHQRIASGISTKLPQTWQQDQEHQLTEWVRFYESQITPDVRWLRPEALAEKSKERTLATFLRAELKFREKATDILMEAVHNEEMAKAIHQLRVDEKKLAAELRGQRRFDNTIMALSILSAAGSAYGQVSAASVGNTQLVNQFSQQSLQNSQQLKSYMTMSDAIKMALVNQGSELSAEVAKKIGDLEVEVFGQIQQVNAGSLPEFREKLKKLYLAAGS